MDDIYKLLNINKEVLENYHLQANFSIDKNTKNIINKCIKSLEKISNECSQATALPFTEQTIETVIQKLINNVRREKVDIWSKKEVFIISYYLTDFQNERRQFKYAISILNANWYDSLFSGLFSYFLTSWNDLEPDSRKHLCKLIRNKLTLYKGNNSKFITIKNRADLFDEAGPQRLSSILLSTNKDLKEAPSFFCDNHVTINRTYYSDVIINYLRKKETISIEYIEDILKTHNLNRTSKLVIADLIIRIDGEKDNLSNNNDIIRTQIYNLTNHILGDVTLSSTWAPFKDATKDDENKLQNAKQILNKWLNTRIIETFFEICVQDNARKNYWLRYTNNISTFKIVGSTITKNLLQTDDRTKDVFSPYFKETLSKKSQTSALILFIKNKMLVEFSDIGALYVYNKKNNIDILKDVKTINDLKDTSMDYLVTTYRGYHFYSEGRLLHLTNWEQRLDMWMNKELDIDI